MGVAGSQAPRYRFGYQPIFSAQVGSRYYTTLRPDLKNVVDLSLKMFSLILNMYIELVNVFHINQILPGAQRIQGFSALTKLAPFKPYHKLIVQNSVSESRRLHQTSASK